jgi:hypothetical protein
MKYRKLNPIIISETGKENMRVGQEAARKRWTQEQINKIYSSRRDRKRSEAACENIRLGYLKKVTL